MKGDSQTSVHPFASSPYHSAFPNLDGSAATTLPTYDLDTLDMLNRKIDPTQAYEGQGGLHQHGLSSGAANISANSMGKKTRFTSDSNIPSVIGMGFGTTPPSQSYLALAQHQLSPVGQHQQQSQPYQGAGSAGLGGPLGTIAGSALGTSPSNGSSTFLAPQAGNGGSAESGLGGPQQASPYSPTASSGIPAYPTSLGMTSPLPNFGGPMPVAAHSQTNPFISGTSQNMLGGFPQHAAFSPGGASFVPGVGMVPSSAQANHGRTVYVGNLPPDASVDELLNHVKFGPIENVRVLGEKNCAFISFLDGQIAAAFHADASVKKLSLHGRELKIGWGKPSPCPTPVLLNVQQHQATRNVYVQLGDDDTTTEESLRDDLSRFGPIDQVKIVRDKNIGFVHFLSIATAIKVVTQLPQEPAWKGKRVHYGKDRCAYIPKSQQQNQAHNSQAAAMGMAAAASLGYQTAFGFPPTPSTATSGNTSGGAPFTSNSSSLGGDRGDGLSPNLAMQHQIGNRTVYLGNLHPDTTTEEICNHIRGGILQTVRYIPDKHIAFVTFVDANSALAFQHMATCSGVMIHNRRLKIGWGKHSGPLSPAIAMAVQSGGSRNVYVGNISDPDYFNQEKLRADFSEHGEVEMVNSLREKNCAFVNFCNIQNAIKAIEAMKNHEEYQHLKIFHGKDRCGRSMALGSVGGGPTSSGGAGPRKFSGSSSPTNTRRGSGPGSTPGPPSASPGGKEVMNGKVDDAEGAKSTAREMPPIDPSNVGGEMTGSKTSS